MTNTKTPQEIYAEGVRSTDPRVIEKCVRQLGEMMQTDYSVSIAFLYLIERREYFSNAPRTKFLLKAINLSKQ